MENRLWKVIGFWALGLILFISTLIIIRWAVDFATWSTLDSGWAQAIGSVAALGVAIYVMAGQNAHATRLMIDSEAIALDRRLRSVLAILDEAAAQVAAVKERLLGEGRFSFLRNGADETDEERMYVIAGSACTASFRGEPQFTDLVEVINQIPVHELGHQDLVKAVFAVRRQLINYDVTLTWLRTEVDKLHVDKKKVLASSWNGSVAAVLVIDRAREQFEHRLREMMGQYGGRFTVPDPSKNP